MKIDKKQVGQRIKELRQSRNLTLDEVAKIIHAKGKSTVNAWERGATVPRNDFLVSLCKLFNVSKEELLFGSLDTYLLNLIINDYQSENSLTHSSIENYLNLTSERLDFLDSLPFNYAQEEAPQVVKKADADAIRYAVTPKISLLTDFLGPKLKYNNDREILKLVAKWFNKLAEEPMNSFLGQYRELKHDLSMWVPSAMGLSNKTVDEVLAQSNYASNKQEALELIFKSKMADLQTTMLKDLEQLKSSYEKQAQKLDS